MKPNAPKYHLTAHDVCLIIKECGVAKVAKLEFCGLRLEFGPSAGQAVPDYASAHVFQAPTPTPETEISEIQRKEAEKAFVKDEVDVREDQIAELLVTDPVEAEKLLIAGELEEPEDGTVG